MNTPLDNSSEDLRYAEYVVGVLDADARAAVEREIASDPRAATEVARWQAYLLPLVEGIAPRTPPDHLWVAIENQLRSAKPPPRTPAATARGTWWNTLPLWRGLAFGAGAVAAACIIALAVLLRSPLTPPATSMVAYMASTITQNGGQVGWTATMDLQHARMVVVPAQPQTIKPGRAPELWLIPAGRKPIAVGMIASSGPTTIVLPTALVAQLGPSAVLAVSLEPPGGSPTGQPTGPVIAKGAIATAVQNIEGKSVARVMPDWRKRDPQARSGVAADA